MGKVTRYYADAEARMMEGGEKVKESIEKRAKILTQLGHVGCESPGSTPSIADFIVCAEVTRYVARRVRRARSAGLIKPA